MRDMQHQLADLSPERRKLLEHLVRQDSARTQPVAPAAPKIAPLSFAQQRLWFLDRLQPLSSLYTMPAALRLRGALDVTALQRSLAAIVARHETLRTTFAEEAGEPVQVIAPALEIQLQRRDAADPASGLPADATPAARETWAQQQLDAWAQEPFDLQHGPLLRVHLLSLTPTEHLVLLLMHHIICDGWSRGVIVRELVTLYAAYANHPGEALSAGALPPLPLQYADYAAQQRAWLQGPVREEQLRYWLRQLADLPRLALPTDYPRPAVASEAGAQQTHMLPATLAAALHALSLREGATLFMTLLTAFQALLQRYSGQDDIVVGSGIANRTRAELEPLIGFFVNTLALRSDLSGDPSFRAALQRVRQVCLQAYAHQDLPFEQLVEALQPERDLSYAPLFQISFVLHNTPLPRLTLPGLEVEQLELTRVTAKFDLSLFAIETAAGLQLRLEYRTDLFAAATIARLLAQLETLLHGIAAAPDTRLSQLPLLPAAERRQVMQWSRTAPAAAPDRLLPELIAAQAARTPDAVAAAYGAETLTYGALLARAHQLAHVLQARGVGPEVRVGICLERSLDLVVAVLGVWAAGGALVPLDPAYPAARRAFLLDDAAVAVLLTHTALREELAPTIDATAAAPIVLCLDEPWNQTIESSTPPPVELHPDNLAYIIYTSGSTGQPKGVLTPHRGLPNLAAAQIAAFGVEPHSRVLQWATLSFDAAVAEIVVTLLAGAALVLAPAAALAPGPALAELLREQAITTITLPPSALAELPPPASPAGLPALATLVVAGEACTAELAARWAGHWRIVNAYGPSEATVCATIGAAIAPGSLPPIGRPIPGVAAYVLDALMEPVPIGAPGELYLGGPGLARGYLDQPALTAARFTPDPWSGAAGARLYRTGDRVRFLPDGQLAFLSRVDDQIKLRGVRIEPGEIEAVLREHPAVHEATALLDTSAAGRPRLAAFITPQLTEDDASSPTVSDATQVAQWQALYDDLHRQASPTPDLTFNPLGWVSSATREPIPDAEMREWVAQTVARIQTGRPRRILELGCGLGLLLFPLAPHCERYTATDVSAAALAYVAEQLAQLPQALPQVTLQQRAADDLAALPPGPYDTILLNSVVQYFPSVAYLRRVIMQAAALSGDARIFIGDVRSLPLLGAFHAVVALDQADATEPRAALALRAAQATAYETELVIDPALFTALRHALPSIRRVQILLKRGRAANELTQFRYDVLLDIGSPEPAAPPPPAEQLTWTPGLTAAALRAHLEAAAPERLILRGAPNARLTTALRTATLIDDPAGPATAGALRAALAALSPDQALDPEDVWALGEALGYTVLITWAAGAPGAFDATFARDAEEAAALLDAVAVDSARPWASYASAPHIGQQARALGGELRRFLEARLPRALVPTTYTVLPYLPRTPVGKRDRDALRALRSAAARDRVEQTPAQSAPRNATERTLAAIWATALGLGEVGIHDNFFALGGDSLLVLRVTGRATEAGLTLAPRQLFQHQTIAELAAALGAAPTIAAEQGIVTGDVPFTQFWFFEKNFPEPHHWNVSTLLEVRQRLDPARVRAVVQRLVEHHDGLRLRYARDGAGWRSYIAAPDDEIPFVSFDLTTLPAADQRLAIETHAAQLQRSLDLERGPLLRVALFDLGPSEPCRLLVIAHHLAADGASLQILLEDFQTAYQQLDAGLPITLPPKTTSFLDWSARLLAHAQTPELKAELSYWLALPWQAIAPLPVDFAAPRSANTDASMATLTATLDQAATERLLQETLAREDAQINEALLAALALAFAPWTGRRALLTEIVVHGRLILDGVDLSRTVGWLAAGTVAILDPGSATTSSAALQTIKANLRQIPDSYGILRYLCKDAEIARQIRALPTPDIMFNYLGQFDQVISDASPFRPAKESRGRTHNELGVRERLLEVLVGIFQGQLQMTWRYSRAFHERATIERLAEAYLGALRSLIQRDEPPA